MFDGACPWQPPTLNCFQKLEGSVRVIHDSIGPLIIKDLANGLNQQKKNIEEMSGVRRIKLGSQGLEVSAIGLGCMGMSQGYGPAKPEEEMIKVIHHAINSGVTHLDTSDVYGPHTNEILVGKALKGVKRSDVQLATKFGVKFGEGTGQAEVHGEPEYVRACCEASLKRLDVDYIDLYYVHRIDTSVPIEITMGELKKLVEEGKIKYIGLSEAGPATIRRAHAVHPITAVQLEWSLWTRDAEEEVISTCRELGIGIVPYSPLGSGFLASGPKLLDNLQDNDMKKVLPRMQGENWDHNKVIFERIDEMAKRKGCTPSQLALAWVLHQGDDVGPIPGTTKIENLNQNLGALTVKLTADELAELDSISFKGARLPEIFLALKGVKREDVQLATKFGVKFGEHMGLEIHGEPEYVRACCEASLKRLDVDYIDLYYVHRIDTSVPIEITMRELKKLVEEGKIKYIGLSEAGPTTIRRAHAVHPITAVQLEWSLWTRDAEEEVISTCRELGIGIVPYSPLGSGFLALGPKLVDNADYDSKKILPRMQGENFEHNNLALTWVLHQGDDVGPIPGTTNIENLNQNLGALTVKLTVDELAELDTISFKGARLPEMFLTYTYTNSDTPPLSSWKTE
ncbi:hypothetical protein LXL04_004115 [Taraxacum kok-saghyz]